MIDPLSLADYEAHGGLAGLRPRSPTPAAIVQTVIDSGLRGRGGAGFPTGIKWQTVAGAEADRKYIVCNADEGDQRHLRRPDADGGRPVLADRGHGDCRPRRRRDEGLRLPALGIPRRHRHHDPRGRDRARRPGLLGDSVLGSGHAFDMEIRVGAGAYVCGEETSLLNSLEGKRGVVRAKPPLPALEGLFGKPTVVNNVISLATVPVIFEKGAEHYASFGLGRSRGTIPIQIAGNVRFGGLFETAFGMPLGEIVEGIAGGTRSGRPVKAVQVGGPLGAYSPGRRVRHAVRLRGVRRRRRADRPCRDRGVRRHRRHGRGMARFAFEFCAVESCGKCTPCRIGAVRGVETIDRMVAGEDMRDLRDRPLRDDARRLALRARRVHPLPGDVGADAFSRGFRRTGGGRMNAPDGLRSRGDRRGSPRKALKRTGRGWS